MSTASNNDASSVLTASGVTLGTPLVSPLQVNPYGRGVKVFVTCSVFVAGSFTVTVQGVMNGIAYTALVSAAIVAAGTTVLTVYPGIAAVANVSANDPLPRQWQVTITPTAFTGVANIGACVIV